MGAPRADQWIRHTTTASVVLLAAIAAVVSYAHMHELVLRHGESLWSAALIPLSVDGMIVAASMSLLLASRRGSRGSVLPWALLVTASLASLGANVAVAEPTVVGRIVAAWPSFALIGAYELFMAQIRQGCSRTGVLKGEAPTREEVGDNDPSKEDECLTGQPNDLHTNSRTEAGRLQRAAWQWAQANKTPDGVLPSGKAIADQFFRSPRWGRLVKSGGLSGEYR
ncbi:DUF2637 domain-containing protein [Sphaerisporangium dianthi]|uniref:DUF2637 domain-containing protein n=1 Tax=Sphaerisporangium dianthi TaxID=1436120 RepID=A0ABV9CJB1_9ACTN